MDKESPNANPTLLQKIFVNRYIPFIGLFVLYSLIGIGTPVIWSKLWKASFDGTIESDLRYNCFPLRPVQTLKKSYCNLDRCLWDQLANNGQISCYYRMERNEDLEHEHDMMPRYQIANESDEFNYILNMKLPPPFIHNEDNIDLSSEPILQRRLSVSIQHYSNKHFRILIKPVHEDENMWSKHLDYNYPKPNNSIESEAEITVRGDIVKKYFQLKVRRKSNNALLFNMGSHTPFIFADGHIEITTLLINDLLYGLGQSNQPFRHNFSNPQKWQMFNQYQDNLTENAHSLFGSHPFYMGIDDVKSGNAYGVLLVNTFPIQAITNARPSLTLKTLGGHLEFHFFLGPRPNQVIKQMLQFIQPPFMPPYWSLGFHMCRTSCKTPTIDALKKHLSIPIESDCGTSMINVPLNDFVSKLHAGQRKWLSVLKPLIPTSAANWNRNVLKENNKHARLYKGIIIDCHPEIRDVVQSMQVYYPDFFNDESSRLYRETNFEQLDNADGFLLDYNTPLNMANGNESCLQMLKTYKWDYYGFAELNEKNPCMDLLFSKSPIPKDNSDERRFWLESKWISLHNVYGYKHAKIVYEQYIQQHRNKRRPFLMSLATFMGSGRFAGHLATPINGTWEMLRFSLKQMLDFSLFGIAMTGFPVGGYKGEGRDKHEQNHLMREWFQLASMQPFMIAYSDMLGEDQTDLLSVQSLQSTIRSTIRTRYQILPYLYTLFYNANHNGDLVAQPLFFQFPTNKHAYKITDQYMLGPALMVSPCLQQDDSSVSVYFPKGRWYDFYSGHVVWNADDGVMDMSIVNINIHLRGGYMLVTQEPAETVEQSRIKNGLNLIAGFSKQRTAKGELYMDNGRDPLPVKNYLKTSFVANYNNLTIETIQTGYFCKENNGHYNTILESIKLFGVIEHPQNNQINIYQYDSNGKRVLIETINDLNHVQYDNKFGVLTIHTKLDLCPNGNDNSNKQKYFLNWSYFQW